MNRTIAPPVQALKYFDLQESQSRTLQNGIKLHTLSAGTQEVIRIEVVFDAGSKLEHTAGAAFMVNKMLQEGTEKYSAFQLQEEIASLGAFIEINQGVERLNITFYVLNKFVSQLLPIIQEIIYNSTFPQENFENIINITKNNLKINLQKNSVVASQEFKKTLFGNNHYYGHTITTEELSCISLKDAYTHYQNFVQGRMCEVFVSGYLTEEIESKINDFFAQLPVQPILGHKTRKPIENIPSQKVLIEKPEALQSSIRLGKVMFNRTHTDFFELVLVNEILGGYFGSRLMKNIREEKGLTYGISSQLVSLEETGYFIVGTDVKRENTQLAIDEIYKEIEILKKELVSADELHTVVNYMHGSFLGSINSAFALMDKFKTLYYYGLDYSYYKNYIQNINQSSAEKVLSTANKHLNDLSEIVVGNYY
ncbi:MAG: pitrilysin family protein [Cytophagales bacterium]